MCRTPGRPQAHQAHQAHRARRGTRGLALIWLVGWWAGALASEQQGALAATQWALALGPVAGPFQTTGSLLPHPRCLRGAAGVGPRRSVDLARYLWREGADADLEALAGIGPRTARAAREVLAREAPAATRRSNPGPASGPRGVSPSIAGSDG